MKMPNYPFEPRSTAYLEPGQFWAVPLTSGRFACGRVLQLAEHNGKRDTRSFLAGLMDWSGDSYPTVEFLEEVKLLEQGEAHIRTIQRTGGKILGCRSLSIDGIKPEIWIDCQQRGAAVLQGFDQIGCAGPSEVATLPVRRTWGYNVIKLLAEKHFGGSM